MFDSPYPYVRTFHKEISNSKHLRSKTTYQFSTSLAKQDKYLIEVEKYDNNVYVIKFFPKILKNNIKKFNVIHNNGHFSKIISTCIVLMISILKKDPMSNFGFIGSNTIDIVNNIVEGKSNSIRFRIYRYAVESLIGEDVFHHHLDENVSAYLLVNRNYGNESEVKSKCQSMFSEIYPTLDGN